MDLRLIDHHDLAANPINAPVGAASAATGAAPDCNAGRG
jgi:hypothetical protein